MSEWQPIATAPKDGKPFFAWCVERGPFDPASREFADIASWVGSDETGRFASSTGAIPTHWLPIPAPPGREAG
jgi:hypothetical protein